MTKPIEQQLADEIKRLKDRVSRLETQEKPSLLGLPDLSDPDADKILFWDDSEGALGWLTANTDLTITGTDLDVST